MSENLVIDLQACQYDQRISLLIGEWLLISQLLTTMAECTGGIHSNTSCGHGLLLGEQDRQHPGRRLSTSPSSQNVEDPARWWGWGFKEHGLDGKDHLVQPLVSRLYDALCTMRQK